jgi:hypothetical protein
VNDPGVSSVRVATVTGLRFTTSSELPSNPPPTNVDVTLTDPTPTLAIYLATLALPDFPSGRTNCPNDPGYRHTITFTDGDAIVMTAVLNAGGCRDVTISGATSTRWAVDDAYWSVLAQNLGVPESAFFSLASNLEADGGTCAYPPTVNVDSNPSGNGCFGGPPKQLCSGGSCQPLCASSQYEMICYDGVNPDAALGCQPIPTPTPSRLLFYCCPCAN